MSAIDWLERGESESDPFNKMFNLWCAFNNLFFRVGNGNERSKIETFLKQKIAKESASSILEVYTSEINYLLSKPIIDMRGNGKTTNENITIFNNTTEPVAKLVQVFMIIYQVRCNFDHGQKSPLNKRDVELCRLAAPIVAEVVKLTV